MTASTPAPRQPRSHDVRAVFFDAGFTLLHPARPIVEIYVEAARAVSPGHSDDALRAAFAHAWSSGTRDTTVSDHRSSDALERLRWHRFTHRIAEVVPGLLPRHEAWLQQLFVRFDCGEGWTLDAQAPDLLRRLRASGRKVAIVSNWHAGLHDIVAAHGLTALVDSVVVSADVGFRKPHPGIFHEALRVSGVPASSVLHVGDTWDEDVTGAHAAGIAAVHLSSPAAARAGGHRTIGSLAELAELL